MTHSKTICAALLAASLAIVIGAGVAQATESTVPYNVAAGACGAPIAVPANNKPVLAMGTSITSSIGVGFVSILRGNTTGVLSWTGTDLLAGTEGAYISNPGVHIFWLDYNGHVDLQTATSTHLQICNSASGPAHAAGYLTFIY